MAASATRESLERALATGCRRVNLGTAALEDPDWTARAIVEHGDRVAVGLDVRGTTLAARGWTREGGDLWETLARLDAEGCARYVVTDVAKDGMLAGTQPPAAARGVRPHRPPRRRVGRGVHPRRRRRDPWPRGEGGGGGDHRLRALPRCVHAAGGARRGGAPVTGSPARHGPARPPQPVPATPRRCRGPAASSRPAGSTPTPGGGPGPRGRPRPAGRRPRPHAGRRGRPLRRPRGRRAGGGGLLGVAGRGHAGRHGSRDARRPDGRARPARLHGDRGPGCVGPRCAPRPRDALPGRPGRRDRAV